MEKEKLLGLRKSIKSKKPAFIKQDTHKKSRLKKKWKRPRGFQSKIRLHKKGYRREVYKGWGSPSEVAGLHPSGLKIIKVNMLKDLEGINPEEEGAMISKTVGLKKKLDIIKKAKEKGITILNVKDPENFVKDVEDVMSKKKAEKSKKLQEKEKKKKDAEKKTEEKKEEKGEKLSEKLSEEEKKDVEKKKKDKVLIKKGEK